MIGWIVLKRVFSSLMNGKITLNLRDYYSYELTQVSFLTLSSSFNQTPHLIACLDEGHQSGCQR